jgi:hypothetical protein
MQQTMILHYVHCSCVHSKRGLRETATLPYIGSRNRGWGFSSQQMATLLISHFLSFCLRFVVTRNEKKWENLLEELFVFCYCVYCCLVLLINSAIVFCNCSVYFWLFWSGYNGISTKTSIVVAATIALLHTFSLSLSHTCTQQAVDWST